MATKAFQFLFRQERIDGITNIMDEFNASGTEISDTARTGANWATTYTALGNILTALGFGATVAGGAFAVGQLYEIVTLGNTNFALAGAVATTLFTANAPVVVGTGNGTMGSISVSQAAGVVETWSVVATSATNFTVTGSVSGAKAAATVGTPYTNGIVSFTITAGGAAFVATDSFSLVITNPSAIRVGDEFIATGVGAGTGTVRKAQEVNTLAGYGRVTQAVAPAGPTGGTGNGTISNVVLFDSTVVAEVWTITATSATNFTVVGSVSGSKPAATVGVPYNNGIVGFTITAGVTPFGAPAAFTLTVTRGIVLDSLYQDGKGYAGSTAALVTALATPLAGLSLLP